MSDITLWTIARALPLIGLILTGTWFVMFSRNSTGFVYMVVIAAILAAVYGLLTGTEMVVGRL